MRLLCGFVGVNHFDAPPLKTWISVSLHVLFLPCTDIQLFRQYAVKSGMVPSRGGGLLSTTIATLSHYSYTAFYFASDIDSTPAKKRPSRLHTLLLSCYIACNHQYGQRRGTHFLPNELAPTTARSHSFCNCCCSLSSITSPSDAREFAKVRH